MSYIQAMSSVAGTCCGVALLLTLIWGFNSLSLMLTITGVCLLICVWWGLYR